jgi:hypothetical protein
MLESRFKFIKSLPTKAYTEFIWTHNYKVEVPPPRGKIRAKVVPILKEHRAMKTYGGSEGLSPSISKLGAEWR